jgi:signal transduction histidine kinase
MSPSSHKREILFFLLAVLLPCSVLVAIGLRMISQERELAEKRLADERRRVVSDLRQQLLARLEQIKLEALTGLPAGHAERLLAGRRRNFPVALVARLSEGRPVLPWDSGVGRKARQLLGDADFARKVRLGEQQEFGGRDLGKAASFYDQAQRACHDSIQVAYARLLMARVWAAAGEKRKAENLYGKVLRAPSDVTDEQGISLALYAATGLLHLGVGQEAVLRRLQERDWDSGLCPPAMLYMLRDVLASLMQSSRTAVATAAKRELEGIAARLRFVEQALALQRDFPELGLGRTLTGASGNTDPVWLPYGEDTWLVSATPPGERSPAMMIAVRARDVLAPLEQTATGTNGVVPGVKVLTDQALVGEPLGPSFPGMSVLLSSPAAGGTGGRWNPQRTFYMVSLALVLSVTLFSAYLLWRDVRRELRLAELRSQFVSSVSHELKTPLTAIRMFAETLNMGRAPDASTQAEYLETIINETERLTRLLNNVLDFSRIEQGKKIYRPVPTSLPEVLQAAVRAMQYPLAQQGFQLRVEIENSLPTVRADPDAIEQAVLNLLANAMKYSGESREIGLKLRRQDNEAVIEVSDRGVGIPRDEHARIFDKFYRVPSTENQRVPGTGLGLTLVEHIAKAHGGRVEVESEPGKGSTFAIRLPLEGAA